MSRQWRLATHCACAHDMSIRPIQVEVNLYLGQNRYRKPRCRIGLLECIRLLLPLRHRQPHEAVCVCSKPGKRLKVGGLCGGLATYPGKTTIGNRNDAEDRERWRESVARCANCTGRTKY